MRVLRSAAFAASALGIVLAIPASAHPHALDAPVRAADAPVRAADAPVSAADAPVSATDAPVRAADGPISATAGAAPTHHHSPWAWPLTTPPGQRHPTIVRAFEPPAKRWQSGHRGVDLLANPGDPVLAAGAGTVSFAGSLFGRPVVAVDHTAPGRDTLRTTYEPVDPTVKVGDKVQRGQQIGTLAKDATDPAVGHCAPRACLHWGLVRGFGHDAHYLDPQGLLARRWVRLLPIWEVR